MAVVHLHEAVSSHLALELDRTLTKIGSVPRRFRIPRTRPVPMRNDAAPALYMLREGRIKLMRISEDGKALLLELLEPGDVFGEMSVLGDSTGATSAEALEDSVVDAIRGPIIEKLFALRPGLALEIARLIGERLDRLERRLADHLFQRVPTRLARLLIELGTRYGVRSPDGVLVKIRLSQQDMGSLIGASREIVNLTLADFRRQGLIDMKGRCVVLRHQEKLALV